MTPASWIRVATFKFTSHRNILPTGNMRPQRALFDRWNRSFEVWYNESALEANDKQLLASDNDSTKRMLVCISCFEHLEYRNESRFASRTIRNNGLCKRNETRSTACGVMARNFSRVLPSRRTLAISFNDHGRSSIEGNIGSHSSQSVSMTMSCPSFFGDTWFSVEAARLRKCEFAGRSAWAIWSQLYNSWHREELR